MKNPEVAEILYEIADYLEIKGVEWKPRAYRRAAGAVETLSDDIEQVAERGDLQDIPGVGESIASKIAEYLETGHLEYLENLQQEMPGKLRQIMDIEGIGPKTAVKLYRQLGIRNVDELQKAAEDGKIRELEGFGKKTEDNILENISMYRSHQDRFLLGYMLPTAQKIVDKLGKLDVVKRIELAGSIRRRKATIGDADILVISEKTNKVMTSFVQMEQVDRVLSKGERKSTIVLGNGLQVDLLVIDEKNFGAALMYFTGSKEHNVELRKRAIEHNWKLSEYGLEERDTGEVVAQATEEKIYNKLGLQYIPPELRTNRGEIETAAQNNLPDLVNWKDIKGDLHIHSNWSEGSHSIGEMVEKAREIGHEYIAICDHTESLPIAQGLSDEEFSEREKEITEVNEQFDDIEVLSGAEVDILPDGTLDLEDDTLENLDVTVAAVHSSFKQEENEMTERILSAMENEHIDILGHPTGRIIQKRDPYAINLDKVFAAAEEYGTILEVNCFPSRLDLRDSDILQARKYDAQFSLGSDAHSIEHLRYLELGLSNARRGWLEKDQIINTLRLSELRSILS
ncbi:MAG: DNA polymerase/3'-5' exonuclease PolX [Candidatus Thorarchaeota archaeon]